ncbi:MAG TPA: hypothetical protein VFD80_04105 [Flavobacteriaceae bacterium]|nr:hypothetical protein [Flavobacteriaceae bacterium]
MKFKLISLFLILTHPIFAQKTEIDFLPNQPYDRYELKTEKDTLTFYLSVTSYKENLPLIVYIQGSGMNSLFVEQNDRIIPTSGHFTWFNAGQEKYRILIVEKPGVKYLQTGGSQSFDQNFSLENWSNRIVQAIHYVTENEKIDKNKILVAGPSQLYSLYKLADDGTFFNTTEHNMPTPEQRLNYLTGGLTNKKLRPIGSFA